MSWQQSRWNMMLCMNQRITLKMGVCDRMVQKRDIIVTQFINELGVTIETNTKPLIHCKDCIHRYVTGDVTKYYVCDFMDAQYEDNGYCHHGEREEE